MRILRHLSWVSVANAANGLLGLVFVPIAVQRLGPTGYGEYSIYVVLTSYVALLELGLGKNLLRTLAAECDERDRMSKLRLATGVYLGLACLLVLTIPVIAWVVPSYVFPVQAELRGIVSRIAALSVIEYVLGVPTSLMQTRCIADEEFSAYSKYTLISGMYRYAFGFGALMLSTRADIIVAVLVSRRLLDWGLARMVMGRLPRGAWRPRFEWQECGRMLRGSMALSVAQILQVLTVSLGSVFVNRTFGVSSLGVYRVVFDITSKIWFVSNTAGLVLFPRFVRLLRDPANAPVLAAIVPSVVTFSCVGFVALALIAIVIAVPLLPRLGLHDAQYSALFVLMVGAVSLNAHANFGYEFTQAAGRYGRAIIFSGLALAILALAFMGLRSHGLVVAIGGAWLISQVCYTLATDLSVLDLLTSSRLNTIIETGWRLGSILCLLAGVIAWWIAKPWLLAGAIGAVVVFALGAFKTFRLARTRLVDDGSAPSLSRIAGGVVSAAT